MPEAVGPQIPARAERYRIDQDNRLGDLYDVDAKNEESKDPR